MCLEFYSHNIYVEGLLFFSPWVCDRRIVGTELFGPPCGTKLLWLLCYTLQIADLPKGPILLGSNPTLGTLKYLPFIHLRSHNAHHGYYTGVNIRLWVWSSKMMSFCQNAENGFQYFRCHLSKSNLMIRFHDESIWSRTRAIIWAYQMPL